MLCKGFSRVAISQRGGYALQSGFVNAITSLATIACTGCLSIHVGQFSQASKNVQLLGEANGIRWGTATIKESTDFNLGTGQQSYSMARAPVTGYFYGRPYPGAARIYFANFQARSACGANYPGYQGFDAFSELQDVSQLAFGTANSIQFGTPDSDCYAGLLVFRQKEFYGVIEPISMDRDGTLEIQWWAAEKGIVDFSKAPGVAY